MITSSRPLSPSCYARPSPPELVEGAHRRERLADSTLEHYAARLERKLDLILTLAPAHAQGDMLKGFIK